VLGDVTCDSDGKIDQFIDRRDVKRTLPLHAWQHEPYYLGAFLIGAYQEILGDLHNLFGDTNAVHVSADANAATWCDAVIKGDTVREVLDYVESIRITSCSGCGIRSSRRSARAGSAARRRASSCGSTKKASAATRILAEPSATLRRSRVGQASRVPSGTGLQPGLPCRLAGHVANTRIRSRRSASSTPVVLKSTRNSWVLIGRQESSSTPCVSARCPTDRLRRKFQAPTS